MHSITRGMQTPQKHYMPAVRNVTAVVAHDGNVKTAVAASLVAPVMLTLMLMFSLLCWRSSGGHPCGTVA